MAYVILQELLLDDLTKEASSRRRGFWGRKFESIGSVRVHVSFSGTCMAKYCVV